MAQARGELHGKRALVTAGAAGIGRAIAEALAGAGASVWVCDVDSSALASCPPGWIATRCDVGHEQEVDALFAELEARWGGLDILVNNAGIAGPTAGIEEVSPADWRRTIDVNLNGMFYCTRRAVPWLRRSRGAIVNLASVAGRLGYAFRTPYAASKWAVVGLSHSLAKELGPDGVRVNAILPGIVAGPRIDAVFRARAEALDQPVEEIERAYLEKVSLRTKVTAQDVAAMALFLCGPGGERVSGQAISVDGNVEQI
jgi:NAD(P)-dependent dehydrogenase (short-subunit alcohol dehydrogenase family)